MRKKLYFVLLFLFLFSTFASKKIYCASHIRAGFSVGLGLPKIPLSYFRTPFSILGGGHLNYRVNRKLALMGGGYGLYTFNMGTASGQKSELRFNLLWGSLTFAYQINDNIDKESFLLLGFGEYHLSQQFSREETVLDTPGFNLGLSMWKHRRRLSTVFEVKWHLLFRPSNNPQILTLTFGIIL